MAVVVRIVILWIGPSKYKISPILLFRTIIVLIKCNKTFKIGSVLM